MNTCINILIILRNGNNIFSFITRITLNPSNRSELSSTEKILELLEFGTL